MTSEALEWAELIFVMEKVHRARLQRRFGPHIRKAKVVCLDIPDMYEFMDADLVRLLKSRIGAHPQLRR